MTKLYFFVFIFLISNLSAQKQLLLQGIISQKEYQEKIPLIEEYGLLFLEVEINSKKYKFLLDTGAPNLLNEDVFKNMKVISDINSSDSNNQQKRLGVTNIDLFTLGKLEFKNFNFVLSDFKNIQVFDCLNVDGIIGSNTFKDSVIKIDYTNKTLIITNSINNLNTTTNGEKLKLSIADKKPFLPVQLINKNKSLKEVMLFDTGFRGLLLETIPTSRMLIKNKIAENSYTRKGRNSIGLQGLENLHEKTFFTLPTLKLGNTSIHHIETSSSLDNQPKLGVEILRFGNIILDFIKEKYYFESPKLDYTIDKKEIFYKVYESDSKLYIGFVIHPKLQDVLFSGDEITKINDEEIKVADCQTMLETKPATEKITVKRDSKEFIVDLKNLN